MSFRMCHFITSFARMQRQRRLPVLPPLPGDPLPLRPASPAASEARRPGAHPADQPAAGEAGWSQEARRLPRGEGQGAGREVAGPLREVPWEVALGPMSELQQLGLRVHFKGRRGNRTAQHLAFDPSFQASLRGHLVCLWVSLWHQGEESALKYHPVPSQSKPLRRNSFD